jgi:subtilisin family serine protease
MIQRFKRFQVVLFSAGFALLGCEPNQKQVSLSAERTLKPAPVSLEALRGKLGEDPLFSHQWNMDKIDTPAVWEKEKGRGVRRVTVAVVGTGVDYNHPDLASNIYRSVKEFEAGRASGKVDLRTGLDNDQNGYVDDLLGYDFIDEDGFPYDLVGSGTAMAGVVGAVHGNGAGVRGVTSKVTLLPVRYIDSDGVATLPDLIKALEYVVKAKPDVVLLHAANISLSSQSKELSRIEERAVAKVIGALDAQNVPLVVGAGNSGMNLNNENHLIRTLSRFRNVLVVTSVDENDRRPFIANYGMSAVHTAAPGENVMTTLPGGQYGLASGTHIAAAHVAGAMALAISKHYGRYSTGELFRLLLSERGSDPLSGMEFETRSGNRLNIQKFISVLE